MSDFTDLALLERCRKLQEDHEVALNRVFNAETRRLEAQEEWDVEFFKFRSIEETIEGYGRWNDTTRQGYMSSQHPDLWDHLFSAKESVRRAILELDLVKAKMGYLDREIQILTLFPLREVK